MEMINKCDLCETGLYSTVPFYHLQEFNLVLCPQCGLGITNPRPGIDEIGKYYSNAYYSFIPENSERYFIKKIFELCAQRKKKQIAAFIFYWLKERVKQDILIEFQRVNTEAFFGKKLFSKTLQGILRPMVFIPYVSGGKILDIGCGFGKFLLRAKKAGWDAYGIEVSDSAVDVARRMGLQVKKIDGRFETVDFPEEFFDCILLNNVLEHCHYPKRALNQCYRILKKNGYLIVVVPNFDCYDRRIFKQYWGHLDIPRHLYHFNPHTLSALLVKVGFCIEKIKYKKWFVSYTSAINFRNLRRSLKGKRFFEKAAVLSQTYFKIKIKKKIILPFVKDSDTLLGQGLGFYARKS